MNRLQGWEVDRLARLMGEGLSLRRIARETGLSRCTVRSYARRLGHASDAVEQMRREATPGRSNDERAAIAAERRSAEAARRQLTKRTRRKVATCR